MAELASVEQTVFRQYYQQLESTIQNSLFAIVPALYSLLWFDIHTKDRLLGQGAGLDLAQKTNELLSVVEKQISASPKDFHTFLDVMRDKPPTRSLALKMADDFERLTTLDAYSSEIVAASFFLTSPQNSRERPTAIAQQCVTERGVMERSAMERSAVSNQMLRTNAYNSPEFLKHFPEGDVNNTSAGDPNLRRDCVLLTPLNNVRSSTATPSCERRKELHEFGKNLDGLAKQFKELNLNCDHNELLLDAIEKYKKQLQEAEEKVEKREREISHLETMYKLGNQYLENQLVEKEGTISTLRRAFEVMEWTAKMNEKLSDRLERENNEYREREERESELRAEQTRELEEKTKEIDALKDTLRTLAINLHEDIKRITRQCILSETKIVLKSIPTGNYKESPASSRAITAVFQSRHHYRNTWPPRL